MKNKGMFTYAQVIAPWLFIIIYLWVLFIVPSPEISEQIYWYHALPIAIVFWLMLILPAAFCISTIINFAKMFVE